MRRAPRLHNLTSISARKSVFHVPRATEAVTRGVGISAMGCLTARPHQRAPGDIAKPVVPFDSLGSQVLF
jgi:hypothetical protein